jgi:hypothetical protein
MKTYLISYDMASGGDYESLFNAIKKYSAWAHITESLWAIKTDKSAVDIRDEISKYFPNGSRYFVIASGTESAWNGVICSNEWLKNNL